MPCVSCGERAGHAFDPDVAACLAEDGAEILALDDGASAWDEVLALEPSPPLMLEADALDRGLAAMGQLRRPDLARTSPATRRASRELAGAAARRCRIDAAGVTAIRRAGLVHDLGRVAVHARIWQKPGPLTADEWEQVRLHPYHTERVLSRSPFLSALAPIAGRPPRAARRVRLPPRRPAARSWPCRRACSPPPTPTTR